MLVIDEKVKEREIENLMDQVENMGGRVYDHKQRTRWWKTVRIPWRHCSSVEIRVELIK